MGYKSYSITFRLCVSYKILRGLVARLHITCRATSYGAQTAYKQYYSSENKLRRDEKLHIFPQAGTRFHPVLRIEGSPLLLRPLHLT